jgi:pSer/pThr/pTyr-binding forkhead associated (FHA) protein
MQAPGPRGGFLVRADGGRIPIEGTVTIGRHPECTITLSDPAVSRRHAEVRPVMGGCLLVDLSSANGTRVSGAYVAQALLADNDVIEIGDHTFTYRAGDG